MEIPMTRSCSCHARMPSDGNVGTFDRGRRRVLGLFALAAAAHVMLLTGCSPSVDQASGLQAAEIDDGTTCELDGMLLADYGGPKGQIRYRGDPQPVFFCDTVELFHALLAPEQIRAIDAAWVQDMGKADWDRPRGHWIEASAGTYVIGSHRHGSMGPTIASFLEEADARRFAEQHGGDVLRFAQITRAMVDLRGGALHDTHM
jgi:copper chaperone NosL